MEMSRPESRSVFPTVETNAGTDCYGRNYTNIELYGGMTLRDWFAGQALAGLMTYYHYATPDLAMRAYDVADLMLKERNCEQD